jgi:hypothetical protein
VSKHWLLKSNPEVWNIWEWWEDGQGELESWTISRRIDQVGRGDDFVLWVTGEESGVYAHGKVVAAPTGPQMAGGPHWQAPPDKPVWSVELATDDYLFDAPIYKSELEADPDFANALILRIPAAANPVPLTDVQWEAVRRRLRTPRQSSRVPMNRHILTARRVGLPPEHVVVRTEAQERRLAFREAKLLRDFEAHHPNPLVRHRVRLSDGDSMECDAYDAVDDLLIEAKASASRSDIRTAIGQLLDYRRHIGRDPALAVLLPEEPTVDLRSLLQEHKVRVIVRRDSKFVVV